MEKSKKENISIGKISELLKNAPTDDGTFYGCLYDLELSKEFVILIMEMELH